MSILNVIFRTSGFVSPLKSEHLYKEKICYSPNIPFQLRTCRSVFLEEGPTSLQEDWLCAIEAVMDCQSPNSVVVLQ